MYVELQTLSRRNEWTQSQAMPTQVLLELTQETQVGLTVESWGPGCYPFGKAQRLKESGERGVRQLRV